MNKSLVIFLFSIGCMKKVFSQSFDGHFVGKQTGISSTASLKENGSELTGSFDLNGRPGTIRARISGKNCEGTVFDIQMQKTYTFTGSITNDSLYLSIVFPELNNQSVQLQLHRRSNEDFPGSTNSVIGSKNAGLVGLWRYTETFSSGSGDSYASFSTDYFMDFRADGTVFSWTGKSAGGMNDITLEGSATGKRAGKWDTEGRTLIITDPGSGQKAVMTIYVEANRIMLEVSDKDRKILTRVR